MKSKFLIEKDYNISIVSEGLNINEAELEFCLFLDEFKLSIPLKNIKENVFRLRLPSKVKNSITNSKNIQYSINAIKDNLIFEVAKSSFELQLYAIKEVKIEESVEDEAEEIEIVHIAEDSKDSIIISEDSSEDDNNESEEIQATENDDIDINSINSKFKTLSYILGRK